MEFVYNDGGRKDAGYKGDTDDCVCRSISIATGMSYKQVYTEMRKFIASHRNTKKKRDSDPRTGVHRKFYQKYIESLGWEWVTCMKVGEGCKVHLKKEELPQGKLIVRVSKHMTAVIDGKLHDTWDCSREGSRCVYGYFRKRK